MASDMQQRMRAHPDKPAEKKDHKNRNGVHHVRRQLGAVAMTMTAMTMAAPMPVRADGRVPDIQVGNLWLAILEHQAMIRGERVRERPAAHISSIADGIQSNLKRS